MGKMNGIRIVWFLGVAAVFGVWLLTAYGSGQPDIVVGANRHDFGQVKQGDVVTAEIAVHNNGTGDLTIDAVSTSCGCTTVQVQPEVIPPSGEGRLFIQYDSGAHPDKGSVQRHIYIASNDPNKTEVEIIITAYVQPPVQ